MNNKKSYKNHLHVRDHDCYFLSNKEPNSKLWEDHEQRQTRLRYIAILKDKISNLITSDTFYASHWLLHKSVEISHESQAEKVFKELAKKWKLETGLYSTTFEKVNDTYLDIIGLGREALPFILNDLASPEGTAHWHTALKAISKTNPISFEDMKKPKKIKEGWIRWGKENKLIH